MSSRQAKPCFGLLFPLPTRMPRGCMACEVKMPCLRFPPSFVLRTLQAAKGEKQSCVFINWCFSFEKKKKRWRWRSDGLVVYKAKTTLMSSIDQEEIA